MSDLISREDAIKAVAIAALDDRDELEAIKALPSAEAEPTVIRSRTFMPTKYFKEWAKRIREINPNAVVIPCDAEVVSAEAESDDLVIKGAKGIQDGLYNIKDGKLFKYKANGGTVRTYPIVPSADAVEVDRTSEWVAVRREEYEDLIAEAVQGEWERVPTRTYKGECTNCGFRHIFMDGHDSQYRFCPNCGAKMHKGGEDE